MRAKHDGGNERRSGLVANVVLSLLLAFTGWFAVQWRELVWPRYGDEKIDWSEMGMDLLQQFSFDVPFVVRHSLPYGFRPPRNTDEVVLLYMDKDAAARLKQTLGEPWDRSVHAALLDKLTEGQARAVIFDVVFDMEPRPGNQAEIEADEKFAAALSRNGRTYLGAALSVGNDIPLTRDDAERARRAGLATESLIARDKKLYKAARGWGLLTFRPIDSDNGVRRLFIGRPRDGLPPWPSITWQVAKDLNAALPDDPAERFRPRWLNYYGPARRIESVSCYRAVLPDSDLPADFFKDRIVIVGAQSQLASAPQRLLDEFSTPWSRFSSRTYTPGAEIHATALLNLLHHDWLERVSSASEKWIVVLLGLALGLLRWLRPWRTVLAAFGAGVVIFAASCVLQWQGHLWWNWAVPVLLQLPLAAVLAVTSRYYLEERRKRQLRAAFGFYLSPELAEEIAEHNFTLAPGGEKVVATMIFTDLEGFTTLSEKLGDSAKLGEVLTNYFTRTTDEILAEKGTVIKFIGDAVFAAWGAPLVQADHAERAVRAAWRLAQASALDVIVPGPDGTTASVRVRTRIGIHTGEALAGNLGSARRFDYTLIGDAVNFASRLEGANKYTGTTILLSDDTARLLGGKFLLRRLGTFKVKGKIHGVVIHELLGLDPAVRPAWLDAFDTALATWTAGDVAAARRNFEAVQKARNNEDGPSQLYLDRIERISVTSAWTGEIALDDK
ncbi:MAG TPA: adenylate/guanylate cyclase domain-containing protein [Candidatus Didemnitutus sp.]|nr:adenylate/guanylate cyclase domain-containing protein [Candidatus Didemnitutus sp.]